MTMVASSTERKPPTQWRILTRTRAGGNHRAPKVTLYRGGAARLNAAALDELGRPKSVAILQDEGNPRRFGFVGGDGGFERSEVVKVNKDGNVSVHRLRFGIDRTIALPLEREGDVLVAVLPDDYELPKASIAVVEDEPADSDQAVEEEPVEDEPPLEDEPEDIEEDYEDEQYYEDFEELEDVEDKEIEKE